jgi:hypothetical protein
MMKKLSKVGMLALVLQAYGVNASDDAHLSSRAPQQEWYNANTLHEEKINVVFFDKTVRAVSKKAFELSPFLKLLLENHESKDELSFTAYIPDEIAKRIFDYLESGVQPLKIGGSRTLTPLFEQADSPMDFLYKNAEILRGLNFLGLITVERLPIFFSLSHNRPVNQFEIRYLIRNAVVDSIREKKGHIFAVSSLKDLEMIRSMPVDLFVKNNGDSRYDDKYATSLFTNRIGIERNDELERNDEFKALAKDLSNLGFSIEHFL